MLRSLADVDQQTTVRIDSLTVDQQSLVRALIEAKKAKAATDVTPVTASAEGQANDRAAT